MSGRLASPGYPASYPPGAECVWTLAASAGNLVSLSFERLELADSENCNLDYVDVYRDGPEGEHLGRSGQGGLGDDWRLEVSSLSIFFT